MIQFPIIQDKLFFEMTPLLPTTEYDDPSTSFHPYALARFSEIQGTGIQTEVYAALCTTDVHILDIGTLGEVLHIGSAVEYSVDVAVHIDFLCHVAIHHKETGAEEFFK